MHPTLLRMTLEPLRWGAQPLHSSAVLCPLEASVYKGAWQARYPQAMALGAEGVPRHFADNPLLSLLILWDLLSTCPPRALATHPQAI